MQLHLRKYGTKIRVKNGLFEVRYFNEKDQLQKEQFSPANLDSIWLYKAVTLSVAVINLAMDNDIDLIFTNEKAFPIGRFQPHRPNSTIKIQKAQLRVSCSPMLFHFVERWHKEKLEAQIALLLKLHSRRKGVQQEMLFQHIEKLRKILSRNKDIVVPTDRRNDLVNESEVEKIFQKIRGREGLASRIFLNSLNQLLLPRYQFDNRSRRPAKDAFNAFLNYAYAILYTDIEKALINAGINPYIGFMHRAGYQLKSMTYDFIEPFRAETIWVVFQLFARKKISLSEHIENRNGGVFLQAKGKEILLKALRKHYQETKIKIQGTNMLRVDWMKRKAQLLAKDLLSMTQTEELAA